jgi:hypothetical protein
MRKQMANGLRQYMAHATVVSDKSSHAKIMPHPPNAKTTDNSNKLQVFAFLISS